MSNFINRQDAINAVTEVNMQVYEGNAAVGRRLYLTQDEMIAIIESLPSAELERKKGKWIPDKSGIVYWNCSECGFASEAFGADILYHYCPNCGVKMENE